MTDQTGHAPQSAAESSRVLPDPARVARYAEAIERGHTADAHLAADWEAEALAVVAVADEEHAPLVAEVERLLLLLADETYREEGGRIVVDQLMEVRRRAEAAEAKVAKVEALWSDADVTWRCSACGWVASEETIESALWHEAGRTVSMICPECSAEGAFVDHEPFVETISALVHEAWMKSKAAQGVTSRPSEWGEEQMVPYADLSERAKDLDRGSVRAVLDAVRAALADAPAEQWAEGGA